MAEVVMAEEMDEEVRILSQKINILLSSLLGRGGGGRSDRGESCISIFIIIFYH